MDDKHYTTEELKFFFNTDFTRKETETEWKILEHLKNCEVCSNLATEAREEMWNETRSKFKGF